MCLVEHLIANPVTHKMDSQGLEMKLQDGTSLKATAQHGIILCFEGTIENGMVVTNIVLWLCSPCIFMIQRCHPLTLGVWFDCVAHPFTVSWIKQKHLPSVGIDNQDLVQAAHCYQTLQ